MGPSKIRGRQPLKNFTWSIREYFDSHVGHYLSHSDIFNAKFDFFKTGFI